MADQPLVEVSYLPSFRAMQSSDPISQLIRRVHGRPARACLVVAGAGTRALAWVLGEAGASRTVLDAQIPYSIAALDGYVGDRAGQHVSAVEAYLMAEAAYGRAEHLRGDAGYPIAGVACTATIATDRLKRGAHSCHVAWRSDGTGAVHSLLLEKGARDRDGEEEVVSRLVIWALAEASGLAPDIDLGLLPGEEVTTAHDGPQHPA